MPYLSVKLGAKSNKNVVEQKDQRIKYILTRPCIIVFRSFRSKMRFCNVRRASLLDVLSVIINYVHVSLGDPEVGEWV